MNDALKKSIGLELSDIRRSKEYQIVQVAEITGLNKDTISKYENGKGSMQLYIIYTLLKFYDVNISYFFDKVNDRMQKTEGSE